MKNILAGSIAVYITFVLASSAFCLQSVQLSISGSFQVSGDDIIPFKYDTGLVTDPQLALTPDEVTGPGFIGAGSYEGYAVAGNGQVKVFASASADDLGGPDNTGGIVTAVANYSDNLTFNSLGSPGAVVTVHGNWNLSGFTEAAAAAPNAHSLISSAQGSAELDLWGNGVVGHPDQMHALVPASSGMSVNSLGTFGGGTSPPVSESIPVSFVVRVGRPFQLTLTLRAIAGADANFGEESQNPGMASSDGKVDFSHTLSWGGITSVTDSNGNPITDWTVTSDTGFDYSQPFVDVPEPSTVALLVMALPGFFLAGRRLRQNRWS